MSVLNKRCLWGAAICVTLLLPWALPAPVAAHELTMELASYGPFQQNAPCQRAVSRATQLCFEQASRAQIRCANSKLRGRDCTFEIGPIVARTAAEIDEGCGDTDIHARAIGYLSKEEAKSDLNLACEEQSTALISLLYGPAMFSGEVAPGPVARDRCIRAVSRYGYAIAKTALRERSKAFVDMGRLESLREETAKLQRLAAAEVRIDRLRDRALALIERKCTMEEFTGSYGMSMSQFVERLVGRSDCVAQRSHTADAVVCPAPVCGNAVTEPGELCDDGNTKDDDACDSSCRKTACETFASTYDLIQNAIFEDKGCTDSLCHGGDFPANGLDLRADVSYESLVGAASVGSPLPRVAPFLTEESFLYLKLAYGTFGREGVPGSPMPSGGRPPLTPQELEAVRLWIYAGAPRTGVVEETADKLDACLPPPDPIQIEAPAVPAASEGLQLRMPPIDIGAGKENEVCLASYYDFCSQIPSGVGTDYGAFRYKKKIEAQDPLSHHLIIHTYLGTHGPNSGVCRGGTRNGQACDSSIADHCGGGACENYWGEWTCKGGQTAGQACNPLNANSCGADSICGSEPERSVACLGYGPPGYSAVTAPAFGGSQQPLAVSRWAEGVYSEIPCKGIIVWNSHHFNLTARPAQVRAWVNFDYAKQPEQRFPVQGGILDPDNRIFTMNVPPYDRRRYCHQFTFPQGAQVFEISSHMHKRGKLFQIYDPSGALIYNSSQYNDPVQLTFAEPIAHNDADPATRTYRYCAEYDNGKSAPGDVKRRSLTPPSPPPFPPDFRCNATHCVDPLGLMAGPLCTGSTVPQRDASCAAVFEGGTCDACNLTGGVTTEDEMFLFLAYYYCSPDYPETCKDEYGFLGGGRQ